MKIRLIIFFVACLAIAIIAFGELWTKLPQWLSLEGLQRYGVFHWGVLVLCVLWLWMKRQGIIPGMQTAKFRLPFVLAGLVLLALSILLPWHDDLFLFPMLLGLLGAFTVIFSRACVIPAILLAIYGFSVAFPVYMMEWLGEPSSMMVTSMVVAITQILGLPVSSEGSLLQFNSLAGENISTVVTPGCVGYYTIGVFIALYALMMLDIMLPLKKAWYIFLIGLVGTWLQNVLRIVVSIFAAYRWGFGALDIVHNNFAYIIFPLWYALLVYIYLKQAGWRVRPGKTEKTA